MASHKSRKTMKLSQKPYDGLQGGFQSPTENLLIKALFTAVAEQGAALWTGFAEETS